MRAPELRPLGVGEILDVSIKLYLRNAAPLIGAVSVIVIPMAVISTLVILSSLPDFTALRDGQVILPSQDDLRRLGLATGFAAVLQFLGTLVATGAAFKALADAYLGTKPQVGESLRFAGARIFVLIWLNILVIVVTAGGFIALVIPGIYIAVALIVVVPARLLEDLKGLKALRRSRDLVKGRWWPTFGLFLLGMLLIPALLGFILGLLIEAIILGGANSPTAYYALSGVGEAITALLITPFQAAVITVLYFDLRVRKEGFDLELLTRNLGEPFLRPPAGSMPQPTSAPSTMPPTTTTPPRQPPPPPPPPPGV